MKKGIAAVLLVVCAFLSACGAKAYVHTDFVSALPCADCFLCGGKQDPCPPESGTHVGILNLNTLDMVYIALDCEDAEAGTVMECGIQAADDSYVYSLSYPSRGYALAQIIGSADTIDTEFLQTHFCQACLDTVNGLEFDRNAPAPYGIVSFSEKTVRPLTQNTSWFRAGNCGVGCVFREDGTIELVIHDCTERSG